MGFMEFKVENILKSAELTSTPIVVGFIAGERIEGGGFGTASQQARILDYLLKNFLVKAKEVADASRLQT